MAPRYAASRHTDRQYGQSRYIKYSTFRDPGGYRVKVTIFPLRHRVIHRLMSPVSELSWRNQACMCDSHRSVTVTHPRTNRSRRCLTSAKKTCVATRHDNTTPYNQLHDATQLRLRILRKLRLRILRNCSSSNYYESSRHLPINRWSRWFK